METNQEIIHSDHLKRCPRCGQTKPINEFYAQKKAKDGHQCYCKVCSKTTSAQKHKRQGNALPPPSPSDGIKNGTVKPTDYHPMFSKMQQREVIAEIRERINYLRDIGWKFEGNLTFVETKTVKL